MSQEIMLLEENNVINCITQGIRKEDILFAISKYGYFYNRTIIINGQVEVFSGIDINSEIEKHEDCEIKLYQRLVLNPIKLQIEKNKKKRLSSGDFLDCFLNSYEDFMGFKYVGISDENKLEYKNKFRKLMDKFYDADFNEKNIERFIKQHIKFGNWKGEIIYVDYLFNNNVIQNYLLYLRGLKSITEIWKNLDINTSPQEKKEIRYMMNLNNWDSMAIDSDKLICMKLYKIYDSKVFENLQKKQIYKNNFYAKEKIFQLISEKEKISVPELLIKTKHESKYLNYEYTKQQLAEVIEKKG